MSHLSLTEPIMSIDGIEPVLAYYSSLFDNVRKDATEQIRLNVSSAVDSLFDVYVDYIKTITTKASTNHEHGGEKYVPLSLVESGARVMQTKLRQLMSTEIDTTSSKLSELLKAPFRLPFHTQNSHDSDDDDQQDSYTQQILDQLEKNLEDISDVDDDDEDDNENSEQNKRKRNRQKRQTELSCEKIAQMCVLIHKLERYQLTEQTMLLRRLKMQKKEQIDQQINRQQLEQQLFQSPDDEVTFLEEVVPIVTNQNGGTIQYGDLSAQQSPQQVHEQSDCTIQRSSLVSKRILMDQHLLSVHRILPYNCLLSCEAKFATLEDLTAHIVEQHCEIKLFSCRLHLNPFRYKSYTDLFIHHETWHSQAGVLGCTESNCAFNVGWSDVLEAAIRSLSYRNVVDEPSRVVCPFRGCGSDFGSLRVTRGHLMTHIEDRPFVCSFCKGKFKQKPSCRDHIRNAHFIEQELSPEQADNHIQLCGSLSVEQAQSVQLMDNLFIQQKSEALGIATIVSTKPIQGQVDRSVASILSSTPSLSFEPETDTIENVEDMVGSVEARVPLTTIASTSTANGFDNSGKRILVTDESPSCPTKSPKSSVEASFTANQSVVNSTVITSQASPIGQLKPANLDCPHCSNRFEARGTLNAHILSAHKCSKQPTRLFHCAFVGCSASRSHKSHLWCHIVAVHHQTTGNLVEYFDIVDK